MNQHEKDVLQAARDIIVNEAAAVADVANQVDDTFINVVTLLLKQDKGRVIVTGSGTSGAAARRMAHLLSVCGTPAIYLHPMDSLHGTMGAIIPEDIFIAISRGGESDEINKLCGLLKEKGTTIVALTEQADSTMGKLADITVTLRTLPDADPGEVIAMGSTLVTGVWGDALAQVLMRLRGIKWEEMLSLHPAGAVGKSTTIPEELGELNL